MTWIDWLIVLALNGGVLIYGLVRARGTKTSEDWFLGKRSLTGWAVELSMFATNVDLVARWPNGGRHPNHDSDSWRSTLLPNEFVKV